MLGDQYAYRNTGSSTCALIKIFDFVTSAFEKNRYVQALYIDFSKAFDIVDHPTVIKKISKLSIPPNIKNWIVSFLTGRSQIVKCNGSCSLKTPINRGIVQGSALGPFLFCIMASDLKPLSPLNTLVKYADDMTYLIVEGSDQGVIDEYHNAKKWAIDNKLVINEGKTGCQCLKRNGKIDSPIEDLKNIQIITEYRLLGVTIDNTLTFTSHVSKILSVCNQRFYLLKLLRDQGAKIDALHSIYMSLVVNRIIYGLSAWGGFVSQADVQRIDSLFKKAKLYGYTNTVFDFLGLLTHTDRGFFLNIDASHCLYDLLPPVATFEGRERGHKFELPLCKLEKHKRSFLPRCLFSFLH